MLYLAANIHQYTTEWHILVSMNVKGCIHTEIKIRFYKQGGIKHYQ